jgi:hypothetical protein
MSGFPRTIQVGETLTEFPADTWNWLVESVGKLNARGRGDIVPPVKQEVPHRLPVLVRNDTDETIERHQPVGLKDPLPNIKDSEAARLAAISFEGVKATSSTPLAIFTADCPPGKMRPAVIIGLVVAKVDVKSESDEACGAGTNGKLESGSGPIKILWKEKSTLATGSKTGEQYCAVLLGGGGGGTSKPTAVNHFIAAEDFDGREIFRFGDLPQAIKDKLLEAGGGGGPEGGGGGAPAEVEYPEGEEPPSTAIDDNTIVHYFRPFKAVHMKLIKISTDFDLPPGSSQGTLGEPGGGYYGLETGSEYVLYNPFTGGASAEILLQANGDLVTGGDC